MNQRLYTPCTVEIEDSVRAWSRADFEQVGGHSAEECAEQLWPWLRERGYASPEDERRLPAFLEQLGRRPARLRPGIEVRRAWPWDASRRSR